MLVSDSLKLSNAQRKLKIVNDILQSISDLNNNLTFKSVPGTKFFCQSSRNDSFNEKKKEQTWKEKCL